MLEHNQIDIKHMLVDSLQSSNNEYMHETLVGT